MRLEHRISGWIAKRPALTFDTFIGKQLRKIMTKYAASGLATVIT